MRCAVKASDNYCARRKFPCSEKQLKSLILHCQNNCTGDIFALAMCQYALKVYVFWARNVETKLWSANFKNSLLYFAIKFDKILDIGLDLCAYYEALLNTWSQSAMSTKHPPLLYHQYISKLWLTKYAIFNETKLRTKTSYP